MTLIVTFFVIFFNMDSKDVYPKINLYKHTLESKGWELIYYSNSGRYELYNLKEDKLKKNNLASQNPELVYELMQKLLTRLRDGKVTSGQPAGELNLTDQMKQRLRETGYW